MPIAMGWFKEKWCCRWDIVYSGNTTFKGVEGVEYTAKYYLLSQPSFGVYIYDCTWPKDIMWPFCLIFQPKLIK